MSIESYSETGVMQGIVKNGPKDCNFGLVDKLLSSPSHILMVEDHGNESFYPIALAFGNRFDVYGITRIEDKLMLLDGVFHPNTKMSTNQEYSGSRIEAIDMNEYFIKDGFPRVEGVWRLQSQSDSCYRGKIMRDGHMKNVISLSPLNAVTRRLFAKYGDYSSFLVEINENIERVNRSRQ